MITLPYDPACEDLAVHFLEARPIFVPHGAGAEYVQKLAWTIQQTVEDWFDLLEDGDA